MLADPRIGLDVARALDPTLVMRDAGMDPDDWQADLLTSTADRHLLLCSRQSGKSTACAALALATAYFAAPALVLLIAPALRQSQELFRKVAEVHADLDHSPETRTESALRMEFANGSRIVALPGTEGTIRGYSGAKLIIVDEAARVEDHLFAAVRPMLAVTRGRVVALTTPYGARGWFHESWTKGQGWVRTRITAEECPRIASDWLEAERDLIGDMAFRQEYMCEFVDNDTQIFSSELIAKAMSSDVAPLWETPT